jgi:hypothetical protein
VRQALRHAGIVAPAQTIRVQREPFESRGQRAETFASGTRFAKERLWHARPGGSRQLWSHDLIFLSYATLFSPAETSRKLFSPASRRLVGGRIRPTQDLRLFRPDADVPVLRGTAVTMSKREGYLWTTGYVPRLRTYPGFEIPKPILVEVNRGDGELMTVMRDVLALTKVNYNACDYSSGLPVTLKFADRVGEILTASPRGMKAPPLPFRFYI